MTDQAARGVEPAGQPADANILTIRVHGRPPAVTVQLLGEVDLSTVGQVDELFADLLARGCRSLVVDLVGVRFLAVIGLHVLVAWSGRYRDASGRLLLLHSNSIIRRTAAIVDKDKKLSFVDVNNPAGSTEALPEHLR